MGRKKYAVDDGLAVEAANTQWASQRAFLEWRAEVLKVRDMSESRLRLLYQHNYSPADIEADKHLIEFPVQGSKKRVKPGMAIGERRGRSLTDRGRQLNYAKALLRQAEWFLEFRRLEPDMLKQVRADVVAFKALFDSLKAKA